MPAAKVALMSNEQGSPLKKKHMPLMSLSKPQINQGTPSPKSRITVSRMRLDDESSKSCASFGDDTSQDGFNKLRLNQGSHRDKPVEDETVFATKSITQLLAMRYPKNQFKISLPSLQAGEKAEKRQARNKELRSKQVSRNSMSNSRLDSG